jgi:N-acyl-L-homoserine lactone synthetase
MCTADETSSVLAQLDGLAHQLIARAAPIRFAVAASSVHREAVFRLRYTTIVDEGWAAAAALPYGTEQDEYDPTAVHIVGWDGQTLAATARLVFPDPPRRLPTEQEFGIIIEPPNRVVDIGRGIVAPEYRSPTHTVFGGLLARAWLEVRARGMRDLCGIATGARVERYRQYGLTLRVLGPARQYWGEERLPLFLDGAEFARSMMNRLAHGMP